MAVSSVAARTAAGRRDTSTALSSSSPAVINGTARMTSLLSVARATPASRAPKV
ncbi:MAG: hypothetical protein NTX33_10640 [Propionibacteriales bacterium]|nr:hypothetical protein [Propionibacteriales bacterium]